MLVVGFDVDDAALTELHARAFGNEPGETSPWAERLRRYSVSWVGAFDTSAMAVPEDNSPVVAWLASEEAGDVTGRVIEVDGSTITIENGWAHGPSQDNGTRWDAAAVGPALRSLLASAPTPEPVYGA